MTNSNQRRNHGSSVAFVSSAVTAVTLHHTDTFQHLLPHVRDVHILYVPNDGFHDEERDLVVPVHPLRYVVFASFQVHADPSPVIRDIGSFFHQPHDRRGEGGKIQFE